MKEKKPTARKVTKVRPKQTLLPSYDISKNHTLRSSSLKARLLLLDTCVSRLNDIVLVTEVDPLDEPGPKIVFVNEAFERISGYSSTEALGRSPRFLHGKGTDKKVIDEIHQALAKRQPIRREILHYRKDGTKYWVDVDIVPVSNPGENCDYFVAIQRDITRAKKLEARSKRLIESNIQSILFWDRNGGITEANDAFFALVGYSRDDLSAGLVNWVAMTPPEFSHLDQKALAEIAATGSCVPYEKELICKDGSRASVLLGSASFEDDPDQGVCFMLDLTERKVLEKQFLRAQRIESIGALAGGIAHDLNNILAPIMLSIGMLKTLSGNSPQTEQLLATIDASARRGAGFVRQVLSFARGMDGERVEVQPRHLLNDLKTIIRDTFPKDVLLEFNVAQEVGAILGDPTQIHQILLNLCVNARDAMPKGGILRISSENCVIDEQYVAMNPQAVPGRYVIIAVTDTGIGIPSSVISKIFEPFFTTKEIGQGTGLGLSTVMAIVKSHAGFVNVYSELGKGTTFKVYLPLIESLREDLSKGATDHELVRGQGETVLLVDDEPSILTVTSQTLMAFGYRVLTASDGADAIGVYAENRGKIALVVTDIMMPIMSGVALVHALKRINPLVKIVTSSGLDANGNLTEVHDMAVKGFIVKPYAAATLLRTVRDALTKE